jgi:MoxR-like ATPase
VLTGEEIIGLQEIIRKVPVADHVIRYALQFSRLTRVSEGGVPDFVKDFVGWGAGPRASQYLILAGKARALLKGRYHVSTEDIRQVALPVLRHRIVTNFNAEAEGVPQRHDREEADRLHPPPAVRGPRQAGGQDAAGPAGGVSGR